MSWLSFTRQRECYGSCQGSILHANVNVMAHVKALANVNVMAHVMALFYTPT